MADATSPASKHSLKESGATTIFIYSRIQQGNETKQGAPMVEGVATAAVTSITGYSVPVLVNITFLVPALQHQPNGLVDELCALTRRDNSSNQDIPGSWWGPRYVPANNPAAGKPGHSWGSLG